MTDTPPPAALVEAVTDLWRLAPPGPSNLFSAAAFIRLRETCERLYPKAGSKDGLNFALSNALRAFGLPIGYLPNDAHLASPPEVAAAHLHAAFCRTQSKRVHLCPLDLADELPAVKFGPNHIRTFTAQQLEAVIDPLRLKRTNPRWTFDAKRFSEFSWLVVEEIVPLGPEPGARAIPLFMNLNEDLGRIQPHPERFPTAVEAALFAVLLAAWEDWAEMDEVNWRGFRVPWVYTIDDDVFVRPKPPPSPETLSWEPHFYTDYNGEEAEVERPVVLPLSDVAAASLSAMLNDDKWSNLVKVRQSALFQPPIAHFLVRAFLAEGIDEFLAHITAIEAALGMLSDYRREKNRPHNKFGATDRMAGRIYALLGARTDGNIYRDLFDIRSQFLHGRTMNPISSVDRNRARHLARRTVHALANTALAQPNGRSREDCLNELLDKGIGLP